MSFKVLQFGCFRLRNGACLVAGMCSLCSRKLVDVQFNQVCIWDRVVAPGGLFVRSLSHLEL